MTFTGPNLAARPFANERPVRRTTVLIWVLAALLMAVNIYLYQRHLTGQHAQRQTLESLEKSIASELVAIRALEEEMSSLDIEGQNEVVVYLNSEIARRTFSWSRLFDDLEEVLPERVKVGRVMPRAFQEVRHGGRNIGSRRDELVRIEIAGQAPSGDELLQFIDNLFAHPSFASPDLQGEDQREGNRVEFSLSVLYLPGMDEVTTEIEP